LLRVPAPPAPTDFADFWRATFAENARVPLTLATRSSPLKAPDHHVLEVNFDSLGGVRAGGWALLPRNGQVACGFVISHGYGGREAPDLALPLPDAAAIFPCARGFHRSSNPHIPDVSEQHVLHGLERRETYVHRGCAADIWSAATALLELAPAARQRLCYIGGSFGGGIGALSLPWDARFKKAALSVPSFGNHPLRLQCQCNGSGESVRRYFAAHPEATEVLKYFDSATAATFLKIPTLVSPAAFDPSVPPPGQFAVYNAIPAAKELFVLTAGHFEYPEQAAENQELARRVRRWFESI
jgi:cephalosporin-C deacetylase